MIIGNGDIASALLDDPERLYFAAGVSNSREEREEEYGREFSLLSAQTNSKKLVYFSSLCIFYSSSRYAQHKREVEWFIKGNFTNYCIVRLGNIDWGINRHTLINNLRAQAARGAGMEVRDTFRFVISRPEFDFWIDHIPDWNCELNIPGRMMTVQQVVDEYVVAQPVFE